MITRVLCLGCLAAVFAVSSAAAQSDTETDHYLTILPFYLEPDEDRGIDDNGLGISLGYGRQLGGGNWYWEGQFFGDAIETDTGPQTDFYQYGLGLDLHYRFIDGDGFSPFVLLGGGAVRNDVLPDADDSNDGFANAGIGFLTGELGRSGVHVRGEVRYIYDTFETAGNDGMGDWRVGIGLHVPLGRRVVEREKVVTREVQVPAQIVDSDNDGVPDQLDQCPDTLAGLATDNRGCAAKDRQTLRLDDVTFELNSARLTAHARQSLAGIARAMQSEPSLRAEIAGHTDSTGPAEYNRKLSQQRADAVREYLISQGIAAERLRARGYGETEPVADNNSEEGRRANRRVEFRVIE